MYKKYLIVTSKLDKAGINITTALSQFRKNPLMSSMSDKPGFDFYLIDTEIVDASGVDKDKNIIYKIYHKGVEIENDKTNKLPNKPTKTET